MNAESNALHTWKVNTSKSIDKKNFILKQQIIWIKILVCFNLNILSGIWRKVFRNRMGSLG